MKKFKVLSVGLIFIIIGLAIRVIFHDKSVFIQGIGLGLSIGGISTIIAGFTVMKNKTDAHKK